jgi:hypothetical protein
MNGRNDPPAQAWRWPPLRAEPAPAGEPWRPNVYYHGQGRSHPAIAWQPTTAVDFARWVW